MKLTLPQQDVYFEQLLFPDAPIYNIGAKVTIKGTLVYEKLNEAYIKLINQHDTYRSYVSKKNNEVVIETISRYNNALEYVDFSEYIEPDQEAGSFMKSQFSTSFSLKENELLHKFILIKVEENFHYLFSVCHHIITDGWGTSLMFQRLVKNYNELIEHGKVVSEYPFTYEKFVVDDDLYYNSEAYKKDKEYWTQKFKNLPEQLFEKKDKSTNINQSNRKAIYIKKELYDQLGDYSKKENCSTFHTLLGILFMYFGKKHQNNDITIGIPVLNRGKSIFKKTVGLFMGISPLRMNIDSLQSFEVLVKDIKQQLRQDYRYQRFPLGKLIKELGLYNEKHRLFNITLSYEKQNYKDHFLKTKSVVTPLSHHSERVALAIYIREFDELEDVKIDFDYNINYFNEEEITEITTHFKYLLTQIISNKGVEISKYSFLTKQERKSLLHNFNNTKFKYSKENTLIDYIEEQVLLHPYKIAVEDKDKNYTYKEINILSNKVANYLNKDNKTNIPVAVLMNRSANLIVALLGILKSGNSFIPLDSSFPKSRLEYIINHSGVSKIIKDVSTTSLNINFEQEFLDIETILTSTEKKEHYKINKAESKKTAYIIYTSGSTGKPKGVEVGHSALLNFLISMQRCPGISDLDTLFSVTTPSFDISILEFFGPLISGAKLYIANYELLLDPISVVKKIEEVNPTIIQATPSFYQMLYNVGWKGNTELKILCGGDSLSNELAQKLYESSVELWNMYGPTETTIWSSCKKIGQPIEANNIGNPIHNTQIYILDKYLNLIPVGSIGDIHIGGDGLAKGYFKNKELTQNKFITNPFFPSQKIYNTGDVGKRKLNGEIEFLGRSDYQVKIRGYRIELEEVESVLNEIPEIKFSVVVAQKQDQQEALLIAYIIPEKEKISIEEVIEVLKTKLPSYMIPYTIIELESMPLTSNYKVDRKEILAKGVPVNKSKKTKGKLTPLQKEIKKFYKAILKKSNIDPNENFFSLGGHSLNAVKLINLINKKLKYQITLKDVFDYPTIKELAIFLETKSESEELIIYPIEKQEFYVVTPSQYYIWLASQNEQKSIAYNMCSVYMMDGKLDKLLLKEVFVEIIDKYEILRTVFLNINGVIKQKINLTREINFSIEEFFTLANKLEQSIYGFLNSVFKLDEDLLLKIALIQSKENTYLVFKTHHIIVDGWSLEILISEIISRYKLKRSKNISKKLPFQFKDYAHWYINKQTTVYNNNNYTFWKSYMKGYKWKNSIEKDYNEKEKNFDGNSARAIFKTITSSQLIKYTNENNISEHSFIIGVLTILIHKLYNYNDICFGTVNSGRSSSLLEKQIGMFVKTLPFRAQIKENEIIENILKRVHEDILLIDKHQDIPVEIQNELRLDMLVVLENPTFSYDEIRINETLIFKEYPTNIVHSRLPMLLTVAIHNKNVEVKIDYNTSYYDTTTVELFALRFEKLMSEILKNKANNIQELTLLLEEEQQQRSIDINFDF